MMAAFAPIHGAGGSAWDWHLVVPELRTRGHEAVAVDLPCEQESAGWSAYADTVVDAVAERRGVVVVGDSLCGFTAPLVCARIPLSAMIPSPGELFNDVPPPLAADARRRERNEDSGRCGSRGLSTRGPATPTRYLACRDDRMFTASWARRHARTRLGIEVDEMDGGHYVTLSRPRELTERLHAYAASVA